MESMEEEAAKNLLEISKRRLPPRVDLQPPSGTSYQFQHGWTANNYTAATNNVGAAVTTALETVSSSEPSPTDHWPAEVCSALSNGVEIDPAASTAFAELPTDKRKSGRKRTRKINNNNDSDSDEHPDNADKGSSDQKGTRRSSSRKTRGLYETVCVPIDNTALDTELLSKLPSAPSTTYFEEESAWRFHNPAFPSNSFEQLSILRDERTIPSITPAVSSYDLQPLPSPPPLPELPNTGFCQWSFDEKSRVLLAKFIPFEEKKLFGKIMVNPEDERFLLRMMERDDITVISEGLADEISASLWTKEYITGCIGSEYHHKFRAFQKKSRTVTKVNSTTTIEYHEEQPGWYSMKVASYFEYLEKRRSVQGTQQEGGESSDGSEKMFSFEDSNGKEHCINAEDVSLYMIDVDLIKLLPKSFEDLQNNFKLSSILPGGSHCMMNAVNVNGRPFMGPNLYITPPSSFTHFHQDGHVSSLGYNEVVMLRRLPERHKCRALELLNGSSNTSYSTLYGLPHRDDLDPSLGWPTKGAIRFCEEMGYCPSVFILKPGQMVHINKGRLHAFRKLSTSSLHVTDCHHDLRQTLQESIGSTEQLCFSIAWDWMFKGVTSEGINRELSSILECVRLNSAHSLQSLAIPETALLFLAKENVAKHSTTSKNDSTSLIQGRSLSVEGKAGLEPDPMTVLRGILASLQYVVHRHNSAVRLSKEWGWEREEKQFKWAKVSIDEKPNTWQDPGTFSLDPYGAGDFFCKFCMEELSNIYMHCDGCEKLLNKDFNICSNCHKEGKYKVSFYQMHPFSTKRFSVLNHTGNMIQERAARCPCKNGKPCSNCNFCTGCSCKCHQHFTLHYRFMGIGDELQLLSEAERIVGTDKISHSDETSARLLSLLSGTCVNTTMIEQASPHRRETSMNVEVEDSHETKPGKQSKPKRPREDLSTTATKKSRGKSKADTKRPVIPPIDFNSVKIGTAVTVGNGSSTSAAIVKEVDFPSMKIEVCFVDGENIDWVDFDVIQSITSTPNDCFQTRCAFLLHEDVDSVPPSSVDDISRAAIAYTAPRGTVIPPDESVASGIAKMTYKTFSEFIEKARLLESPTEEALARLLPRTSRVRGDEVRHLYRNFADCSTIQGDGSSIMFSRREIDIVNYYYKILGKVPRDMAALMPYRAEKDLRQLAKVIEEIGLCQSPEYVQMLKVTVGILDSLETSAVQNLAKSNSGTSSGAPAPPNPSKVKKQLNLRQSPELTEEERQMLPQWAVSKTVEWRKLVHDGDPRPVFGCDWCGPKIRNGYNGPLLVKSKLCPTCKEFEKEGYYSKMTAGGTKKTFCLGNETVWWSNQAYLMGTTNKVAKSNSQKA
eukprot:scaffold1293_cov139-Skeletonema_menzelii.AAC.4